MPSISVQSTTNTRLMQIYMGVGISLLGFKYLTTQKNHTAILQWYKLRFSQTMFAKNFLLFHIKKIKKNNKEFYCCCLTFLIFFVLSFSHFSLFSVFHLSRAMPSFWWLAFFGDYFFILNESKCWKSHIDNFKVQ